jgi:hypothetical protein
VWDEGKPQPQSAAQAAGKTVKDSFWFKVTRPMIADAVVTGGGRFTDGATDAPAGTVLHATGDNAHLPMVVGNDGELYIKLDLVDNVALTDHHLAALLAAILR